MSGIEFDEEDLRFALHCLAALPVVVEKVPEAYAVELRIKDKHDFTYVVGYGEGGTPAILRVEPA